MSQLVIMMTFRKFHTNSGNKASSSPEMLAELNERLETATEYDIKWVGEITQIDHRLPRSMGPSNRWNIQSLNTILTGKRQ